MFVLFVNDVSPHLSSSSADIFPDDEKVANNLTLLNMSKTKSLLVMENRIAKTLGEDNTPCLEIILGTTEIFETSSHKIFIRQTLDINMPYDSHIHGLRNQLLSLYLKEH